MNDRTHRFIGFVLLAREPCDIYDQVKPETELHIPEQTFVIA